MVNHLRGWPLLYQDTPRDVLSIRVSIGISFSEERSDDLYEQMLLGMLVTYTDPYEQAGLGMIGLYVK